MPQIRGIYGVTSSKSFELRTGLEKESIWDS